MVLGLSMYPGRQVHFAKPLLSTEQRVLGPHGDGSQEVLGNMQGEYGGSPSYPGRQKQVTSPFTTRHPELAPQGLPSH